MGENWGHCHHAQEIGLDRVRGLAGPWGDRNTRGCPSQCAPGNELDLGRLKFPACTWCLGPKTFERFVRILD